MLSWSYLDVVELRTTSTRRVAEIWDNYVVFSKNGKNMLDYDICMFLSCTVPVLVVYYNFLTE